MSSFLKATAVRDTVLAALSRMTTMAPTVWRNAGGSFKGVSGDTITVRVPAYTKADDRVLRSGTSRSRRGLFESNVTIPLEKNLYRDVALTDEEQTLDIMNFSRQVLNPMLEGIARGIEAELVTEIEAATYQFTVPMFSADPYDAVVDARKHLNNARVPFSQRFLAVGSEVEAKLLKSDNFARADQSGTTSTLREGEIGRIAGFTVVSVPALTPTLAFAYHQTAYALAMEAPIVPQGAPSGFTATQDGFAIRLVQVLDSSTIQNVVAADVFVGAKAVVDKGAIVDGVFEPAEIPGQSGTSDLLVRAVKLDTTQS